MKCIPQTEPVSAIRAANGPWYQSVSKVSMPRPQTSWRPVNQWAATKAAAARAKISWGRGTAGAGGAVGSSSGELFPLCGRNAPFEPNQMPRPTASEATIRTAGTRMPKAPSS